MIKDLSDEERDLLLEVLDKELKDSLHGLHHADSHDYKALLKHRVDLVEALRARLEATKGVASE